MHQESLKNKTIKGVGWSAADALLGQGVTFIVGLVLARLLSPDEYGLIGICLIFTTVLNGIVDSGFSNALIRKKDVTDEDYNTMFTTNMAISIVLYVLLFISAPLVSNFFHRIELTALVRVTGLILFLNALSITQVTILTKNIDFKTKTKASLVSAIISGVIGIAMAFKGYGVWALVAQQLSKQLLFTLCLWVLNKWWPKFTFYKDSFKYMWGFGWKLLASGILNNVWNQLYQVVIGRCYTSSTLGHYTRANEYASIFSSNLTLIVQRVSYPVLAEIQDDKERMVQGYRKVIKVTMFVTAVCMISLGAVSEPLIYTLIGTKWHEAATYLPLICISMSLYPLHAINLNILQVLGRSDIFLYLEILKKIVGIVPIVIGIFCGIYYMLLASIIAGVISLYLNTWFTGKTLNYTFLKQLRDIAPSYGTALVIAIAVYFLKYLPFQYYIVLVIQIIVGMIVGFGISELFRFEEYRELKSIVIKAINKKRNNMVYPDFKVCVRCFTFNQAKYIEETMNGFTMQQTNFPFVCCIVDDASTDGEQEVIKKYMNMHFDYSPNSVSFDKETDNAYIHYAQHKENKNCYFAVLFLKENLYSKKEGFKKLNIFQNGVKTVNMRRFVRVMIFG